MVKRRCFNFFTVRFLIDKKIKDTRHEKLDLVKITIGFYMK